MVEAGHVTPCSPLIGPQVVAGRLLGPGLELVAGSGTHNQSFRLVVDTETRWGSSVFTSIVDSSARHLLQKLLLRIDTILRTSPLRTLQLRGTDGARLFPEEGHHELATDIDPGEEFLIRNDGSPYL